MHEVPFLRDPGLLARRRTKIVATLGPACASPDQIEELIRSGVNCARINGAHGDHATQARWIEAVRAGARQAGRPVAVLYDLQGPKIRIAADPRLPRAVRAGDEIAFAVGRPPDGNEIGVDYDLLDRDVEPGAPLLIDDGAIATEVVAVAPGCVRVRCLDDGSVAQRKGINLPASAVSAPALTAKDRRDAAFAIAQQVDVIALSFVRRADDVRQLQELMADCGDMLPVVAKIEKPQALDELDGILEASWGVMVARGDLGVELSPEEVPSAQKRIIRAANRRGCPVITATQMLESMTRNPRPTRAEASDVANAVLDGTDAVMLSQETAVGRFPAQSVRMMVRILRTTEHYHGSGAPPPIAGEAAPTVPEAVAESAVELARRVGAQAVVAFTQTGRSALLTAQRRPARPILVFTPNERLRNLFALTWGIRSYLTEPATSTDELLSQLDEAVLADGVVQPGARLVLLMGAPTHRMGPPNLTIVHEVGGWSSLG